MRSGSAYRPPRAILALGGLDRRRESGLGDRRAQLVGQIEPRERHARAARVVEQHLVGLCRRERGRSDQRVNGGVAMNDVGDVAEAQGAAREPALDDAVRVDRRLDAQHEHQPGRGDEPRSGHGEGGGSQEHREAPEQEPAGPERDQHDA
jgi:hypothetical protein